MRVPSLLLSVVFCGLAFPALSDGADAYRYPSDQPAFSVTFPDGWELSEKEGPAQLVLCTPPNDSTYVISVLLLPVVGGKTDLQEMLTRVTRTGAEGSGLEGVTVGAAVEGPIANGGSRTFTKITASGKLNGEAGAYTFYAFTMPATGRSYAIGVAGLQAMIDAHRVEFEAVVKSILPVR